ncbi:hypothetical protein JHK87_016708 [Glycine soja]|nr:hypothetical protein JHK87_016708 [Glycine soja]
MDVKALAKSKRSHTQHHSKNSHHSHKPNKAASSSSSSSSQVSKEKKKKSHHSALPSNWDRYEDEEEELDSGSGIASKTVDVVLPKSKGADFRHLVAEAQSQAETSLEGFPAFNDLLPGEFGVGLSSMLVVRGEGIVSWAGDDNFVVEDKTNGNLEASFLSLNLHALAESFAKVDLAKRLFIEADLLPTELCVEESAMSSSEEHEELKTKDESELANRMSEELDVDDLAADQFISSSSSSSSHAASTFPLSNDFRIPVNYVDAEAQQTSSSGKNKAFVLSSDASLHSTEDTRGKPYSTFEAADAEKELDMLLDSFGETNILDSSGFKSNTSIPVSSGVASVYPPHISNKDPVPSKTAPITASLDDVLDDLLEGTSTLTNPNVLLRPQEEKPVHHSMQSSSNSGSKSKVADDFDSWFDTL